MRRSKTASSKIAPRSTRSIQSIFNGTETDLYSNLISGSCDIASGVLTKNGGNGIPDEYENLCVADLNGDGVLNFFDVSVFLNAYQARCP